MLFKNNLEINYILLVSNKKFQVKYSILKKLTNFAKFAFYYINQKFNRKLFLLNPFPLIILKQFQYLNMYELKNFYSTLFIFFYILSLF